MTDWSDPRYVLQGCLSRHGDRCAYAAQDRLTGDSVFIKRDRLAGGLRELEILLVLPPGVGPALRDAVWDGDGELLLVMEALEGRSLWAA